MKKVIDNKMYNTKTAKEIAHWDNGYYGNDFKNCQEALFLTKKGQYFVYGSGGPMSKYAESCGNGTSGGEDLYLLTKKEAVTWCEEHDCIKALETHFADSIEEG